MRTAEKPIESRKEVGRPTVLILAASERAPAYEAQIRVIEEQADEFDAHGILVGCVLQEGESRLGSVRLEPEEAEEIRRRYAGLDEAFQIVVLNESGDVLRSDDAPLQGEAILRALNVEQDG